MADPTAIESVTTEEPEPTSGAILVAGGLPSVVRIPIPGTKGLCIELLPRGWVPKGGSTSTLFFQDLTGKRHLRLDYGFNERTQAIDYHWNQKGTFEQFGLPDHAPAGRGGAVAYKAARFFKYAGRTLLIAGLALDVASIVVASKPLRRASEVVAGWASAWLGCRVAGAGGARIGMLFSPLGTAVGGIGGCLVGGGIGYFLGAPAGAVAYDWAEDTFFTPVPEVASP